MEILVLLLLSAQKWNNAIDVIRVTIPSLVVTMPVPPLNEDNSENKYFYKSHFRKAFDLMSPAQKREETFCQAYDFSRRLIQIVGMLLEVLI